MAGGNKCKFARLFFRWPLPGVHHALAYDSNECFLRRLNVSMKFSGLTMGTQVSVWVLYHAAGHVATACACMDISACTIHPHAVGRMHSLGRKCCFNQSDMTLCLLDEEQCTTIENLNCSCCRRSNHSRQMCSFVKSDDTRNQIVTSFILTYTWILH